MLSIVVVSFIFPSDQLLDLLFREFIAFDRLEMQIDYQSGRRAGFWITTRKSVAVAAAAIGEGFVGDGDSLGEDRFGKHRIVF